MKRGTMTESTPMTADVGNVTPRRRPGRPARGRTPFVRITVNLDPDLYTMIEGIADHVGIPASRVLNQILRSFHDAEYSSVDYGFVPGKESNLRMVNLKKWPQRPDVDESQRSDGEVRA